MDLERLTAKGYHPVQLHADGCTGCALCAVVCPDAAITVYQEAPARRSGNGKKELAHAA
jgi:2-oxoglutarate ferredoxin oxidoreductase subunit delta